MLGLAIAYQLVNDAAVTALVGDRIKPNHVLQGDKEFPMLVYETENMELDKTLNGGNSGLVYEDVTVSCGADTYAECQLLAQAVINALDEQAGTWGGIEVASVEFQDATEEVAVEPTTEEILFYMKDIRFSCVYYLTEES